MSVLIETTLGDIVVDLFVKERPNACKNFLKLCKCKYYNLNQFYEIEKNYVARTGDPQNSGKGGESVFGLLYGDQARYFEMEAIPKLFHKRKGLLSMINNGHGMLGSQFFITLADDLDYLDGKHCVFGAVVEGMETVDKLNDVIVNDNNEPYRDIRISHTIIVHDPFEDPPRLPIPRRSPSPTRDLITQSSKIALDEKEDEDEGKDEEQIRRELEEKEAKNNAQILTILEDLHHADEKPPENVLFVCKLNPVTTDEDLEIIFSRFGNIKCCEIIREKRTGQSLQYAFIEFETEKACEAAYLKMDNVLIDDRRIHVDFSQSVAKNYFQWRPKDTTKKAEQRLKKADDSQRRDHGRSHGSRDHESRKRDDRDPTRERKRSWDRRQGNRNGPDRSPRRRSRSREHRRRHSRSPAKKSSRSHRRDDP